MFESTGKFQKCGEPVEFNYRQYSNYKEAVETLGESTILLLVNEWLRNLARRDAVKQANGYCELVKSELSSELGDTK